jgi:hypothetical protein
MWLKMLALIVFSQGTDAPKEGSQGSNHLHEDGCTIWFVQRR